MSTPRKKNGLDEPYHFGDAIPAPEVVERDTETTWALFQELSERHEARFADTHLATEPAGLAPSARAYAPTEPSPLRPQGQDRPAPMPSGGPGIAELLVEARRNNRVCPRPQAWQALHDSLPGKRQTGRGWEPPAPTAGDAWRATSALAKRMVLRDHLEWAASHGAASAVHQFLRSLPEGEWLHMDDT